MKIAFVSGKGGAGKTTIAANYALVCDQKVWLADCDVEEPNLHLYFNTRNNDETRVTVPVPSVDEERCTACGVCVDSCAYSALAMVGERVLVFEHLCRGCGGCTLLCPENAITENRRPVGTVYQASADDFPLVYGTLDIGEIQAPTIIREVKKRIPADAPVIIDGPPGASCSLVTTLLDLDYVVVVAENTPFGLHDAKKAVEAVKDVGIPFGAVINKYDDEDTLLDDYFFAEGIPVLMRVPLEEQIAVLSSQGRPFVREMEKYRSLFSEFAQTIEKNITSAGINR